MPRERAISTCNVTVNSKQYVKVFKANIPSEIKLLYPSVLCKIITHNASLFHIAVLQRAAKKSTKISVAEPVILSYEKVGMLVRKFELNP